MAYHKSTLESDTIFFCTFTCYDWLHLFEIAKFYDGIYDWFRILLQNKSKLLGYVIMPNHLHFLLYYAKQKNTLNQSIGNGKRFMAYEIVKRLKNLNEAQLLEKMKSGVSQHDSKNGKFHQVFELSFEH